MYFFNNSYSLFPSKASKRNMISPSRVLIPTSHKILGVALTLTVVLGVLACTNPFTIIPGVVLVVGALGIGKVTGGLCLATIGGALKLGHSSFCLYKINKAKKVMQAIGLSSVCQKKAIENSSMDDNNPDFSDDSMISISDDGRSESYALSFSRK